MYSIHPTNESIVLTPDNGCIECKHEAAAKRVAAELNERIQEIARLRSALVSAANDLECALPTLRKAGWQIHNEDETIRRARRLTMPHTSTPLADSFEESAVAAYNSAP